MTNKSRLTPARERLLIKEIYDNFPESSMCLRCVRWNYAKFVFTFVDEDGKEHVVRRLDAVCGLHKFIAAVDNGKLPGLGLPAGYIVDTGKWDAFAFDAVNQFAIYGEVIYG